MNLRRGGLKTCLFRKCLPDMLHSQPLSPQYGESKIAQLQQQCLSFLIDGEAGTRPADRPLSGVTTNHFSAVASEQRLEEMRFDRGFDEPCSPVGKNHVKPTLNDRCRTAAKAHRGRTADRRAVSREWPGSSPQSRPCSMCRRSLRESRLHGPTRTSCQSIPGLAWVPQRPGNL